MRKEYIIGGTVSIIVLSILVFFTGYALGKKNRCAVNVEQSVAEKKEAVLPSANNSDVPLVASEVPSVSGMLREIKDNGELMIETSTSFPVSSLSENLNTETEMITASTSPDTEFIQARFISLSSAGPSMEETEISLSAFKAGDHVVVISAENIEGQKAIVANRVKQIITGTEEQEGN